MKTFASKTMIVLLHGWARNSSDFSSLIDTLSRIFNDPIFIVPKLKLATFSCADPNEIVNNVLNEVQEKWLSLDEDVRDSLKIIIIGHSTGAIFARKLYVIACGENKDAFFEKNYTKKEPYVWAKNVDRIILFAGINRGWSIQPHIRLDRYLFFSFLILIGRLMSLIGFYPVGFRTRKGQPFIIQLRIQSLSMYKHATAKLIGNALTIQLLGTIDSIVSPDDNVDLITGKNFIYLDVPNSGHLNVIQMDGEHGKIREEIFIKAITYARSRLKELEVIPTDKSLVFTDFDVTDVVFVLHGIRDEGYWTQKIARRVKRMGDRLDGKKYATETSSYGFFPILSFLSYSSRQNKVNWFMDRYVENLAIYPEANFSFIGHSNGTYLMAKALKDYPSTRFKNVVLAGSVIKKNFNWGHYKIQGRISNVYNMIAAGDWVVGIFPKTLEALKIQDMGSGGFDGFKYLKASEQYKYISGSHGAAVEERAWEEVSHLVIHGQPSNVSSLVLTKRSEFMKRLSILGPLLIFIGILFILVLGYVVSKITCHQPEKFIYLGLYTIIVWSGLTKL
ncbi:MAG: alpha/beta hydrolase [Saprospiraceae bacterium]|nr:alpha/beta hydrolase [Saprospiraceae bacterium]